MPVNVEKRSLCADLALGVLIPLLLSVVLLWPILAPPGIPFYGDEVYYSKWYLPGFFSSQFDAFYAWIEGSGPNSILTLPQYTLVLTVFDSFLDQSSSVKLLMIMMASLPGVSTYVSLRILFKFDTDGGRPRKRPHSVQLGAFVGAMLMMLSFTNSGLTQWGASMVWVYAMLPIYIAFLVRFLKTGSLKDVAIAGVATVIASVQPFGLLLFLIATFLLLILELVKERKMIVFKRVVISTVLVFLFNAFWLVPMSAAYLMHAGGIFSAYATEKLISLDSLSLLSFWNLFDVLMIGERSYYFFWNHPQNYSALSIVIPTLASLSFLKFRQRKYACFMAMALVLGLFLSKGINEPAGQLYYVLASNLPYGIGATLRNPTKFVSLVIFPYSFLVGLLISNRSDELPSVKLLFARTSKIRFRSFLNYIVFIAMISLAISPVAYGTVLDLTGYTWPRYHPMSIPDAYQEINTWLGQQDGYFKVMWLGKPDAYLWKNSLPVSAFPEYASARPSVSSNYVWPGQLKEGNNASKILNTLGVKYLILHLDSADFTNNEISDALTSQENLVLVNDANINLGFEHRIQFRVDYELPSSVVDDGYKGYFWEGFNIRMAVVPSTSDSGTDQAWENKILESFAFGQEELTDTRGTVYFSVTVSRTSSDPGVSLYLNYYDGGYRSVSPIYRLGTIAFKNADIFFEQDAKLIQYFNASMIEHDAGSINAKIYVFENTDPVAPIYVSAQLPPDDKLETDLVTIPEFERISPVEWHATLNLSAPSFLILTEPYDPLWRVYVDGTEVEPVKSYLANAFSINSTGFLNIRIYYTLQDYFNIGYSITIVTLAGVVIILILRKTKFGIKSSRLRAFFGKPRTITGASALRRRWNWLLLLFGGNEKSCRLS
jgi:hypothetical protein